ncbi:MAG: hypothetical protein HOV80_35290, partial [Polyangiaceae bacterium]|nr:hypothetical protein [Polyangiaceae bacterium]
MRMFRFERCFSFVAAVCVVACQGSEPASQAEDVGREASALMTPAGDFESGVYVPVDELPLGSWNGAQAVANGNVAFTFVAPTFEGVLDDDGNVSNFASAINIRGALTLEVRVDAAGDFEEPIPVALTPLPAFSVGSQLVVTPYVSTTVNITGSAEGTSRTSLVAPFSASVEVGLPGPGEPVISVPVSPTFDPELGAPDAAASVELGVDVEVGLIFLVAIDGIPVGGPALFASLGIDVGVSALPTPVWEAELVTELGAAWTFPDPTSSLPEIPASIPLVSEPVVELVGGSLSGGLSSTRWSRSYDTLQDDSAVGVLERGDGAVLVGSSLASRPWMAEIDSGGVPGWQTSAVQQASGGINAKSLIEAANGDLLLSGWTTTATGMRVDRYTAAGVPLWSERMTGPSSTNVKWNTSLATPTGGLVVAGSIAYVSTGTTRCILAELDPAGAILWATEVDLGAGATAPTINALAWTSTGQLLAAGTVAYQDLPSPYDAALRYDNGLVVRLDGDGNVLSAFAVGGTQSDRVTQVTMFPDDSYALGGYSAPPRGSGQNGAWISSYRADDSMRWSATYAGTENGPYAHVSAMAALPSNGLLVTGGAGAPENTTDAWLFRL